MNEGSDMPRRSIDRAMAARTAAALGVLVLVAIVVAPRAVNLPSSTPGATGSQSHPVATSQPAQSTEPWSDLLLDPYVATAALTPDNLDSIGPAPNTTFTLRSLTATPAVDLARGLHIDPPTEFTVAPGPSPDVAVVRPTELLVAGVRYRVRLESPDGALAGSWAFVTRAPLHVVGTLPGDLGVEVPTNTGIEVTFDQDGTKGVEGRFTIDPPVAGRIEQHERTWAFVPDKPLAAATIYTVTLGRGVGIAGSTEVLETDVTFRFETAVAATATRRIGFGKAIIEIRPNEEPVVGLGDFDGEEGGSLPKSFEVTVYRFTDFAAVEAAALALVGPDSWAMAAPSSVVSTKGLPVVATVNAPIVPADRGDALRVPVKLARGHYLVAVNQPGVPVQLLVQVTDLSAFAQTASATTVIWVNDIASGSGVVDASVAVVGGGSLGTTGVGGVLTKPTPAALRMDPSVSADGEAFRPAQLLSIKAPDGRRLLLPLGMPTSWAYEEAGWGWWGGSQDWWLLFRTDRSAYRQTDTIHAYGMVRARSDRSVPTGIELRLRAQEGSADTPILRVPVVANARGVFDADLSLVDLPRASYQLDLYVGDERVSGVWLTVSEIRKPAYQLDLTADRHAYLLGEIAHVSALASFYDGTVVPGVALHFDGFEAQAAATTNALGSAAGDLKVALDAGVIEGIQELELSVRPEHPEEGEISGKRFVLVAPSRAWVSGDGSFVDGRIAVDGTLTWTDLAALNSAWARGNLLYDPAGAPIAGGTIRAQVIHLVPVRHQRGTVYDFIEKRVVPYYEYDINEVTITTRTLTAASNGAFHLALAAPVADDSYRVVLTTQDPEGRRIQRTIEVSPSRSSVSRIQRPYLDPTESCGGIPRRITGLDDTVDVTMHAGDGSTATGRFLFLVSQRGSIDATVQDVATFGRTLGSADLPGFDISAVWLTGSGYATSSVTAIVDPDDKAIKIGLTPDRPRYRPGDTVTIAVRTTDAAGRPLAADVVIQGVDQKLYTLGFAYDVDPRDELLAMPATGLLQSYRSHAVPVGGDDGCGSEGGGRDDFRDTIAFQRITTDANGRGSMHFDLSDDLTSWHMTAVAFSGALDSGQASVQIQVGLPFLVDATLAREYLVGDQPILRVRAYGERLKAGDRVRFIVSAPSLGLAPTTVEAAAFESVRVPLPAMVAGDHAIRIDGLATVDGESLDDALIRTVHVIDTRLGTLASSYDVLEAGFTPKGGPGLSRYVVTDEGRGRFISLLEELASSDSARFDSAAAAELARQLLIDDFHVPDGSLPTTGFDSSRYEQYGIALLPYASAELSLSARAALVTGSKVDVDVLRQALVGWPTTTREQRIVALAGLAGLGDDVLAELRSFDVPTLTVREQLWLALGLAAAGDESAARTIEREVLEAAGERLGPWARLAVGSTLDDSLEATGLMLLLAARLGDPIAYDLSLYLADHPSDEQIFPLEQLGFAQAMLERLPREAARFAVTVAGERTEVELEPGGAYVLVLTSGQRATLALAPIQGKLAVVTSWTASDAAMPAAGNVHVTRTVTPARNAPEDRLVHVSFTVTFGAGTTKGCYRLTDLLPSGLAPVVGEAGWPGESEDDVANQYEIWPYEVDGQRVSWCASPANAGHTYVYAARVVSPGTYRWEPAVIQAELSTSDGAFVPATTYTIQ